MTCTHTTTLVGGGVGMMVAACAFPAAENATMPLTATAKNHLCTNFSIINPPEMLVARTMR